MKVKDLCIPEPFTVTRAANLATATSLMWEHDLGALPVVDENHQVVGMITDRDISMAAYTQWKCLADILVESAMSKITITCGLDDDLGGALELMQQYQIRRVPVLDQTKKLVGIISLNDIALAYKHRPKKDIKAESVADTIAAICRHRPNLTISKQVA